MKELIIAEDRLKELIIAEEKLLDLECGGVDNWIGYDEVVTEYDENEIDLSMFVELDDTL